MRLSWDEYFMRITREVAQRSTCMRRRVGAILVKDKHILTTGYNGAPTGLPHCEEVGCLRERLAVPSGERAELCRGLHAEQNAIIQAAVHGVQIRGSTLYSTTQPCVLCTKMLLNAGVVRIVYEGAYPDELARTMMKEAGLEVVRWEEGRDTTDDQRRTTDDQDGLRKKIVDRYDVVVVGGGIAGSIAARFAALQGFRTLLLEKGKMPGFLALQVNWFVPPERVITLPL